MTQKYVIDRAGNVSHKDLEAVAKAEGPKYVDRDSPALVTVVERIYHQEANSSPKQYDSSYQIALAQSTEQPYVRSKTVSSLWGSLIEGWNKEPSLVSVINESETNTITLGVFDGANVNPFATIGPKQSIRFTPYSPENVLIKGVEEVAKVTLITFPN